MRDKDIEISVVIPVYNSAQTLRELRERLEQIFSLGQIGLTAKKFLRFWYYLPPYKWVPSFKTLIGYTTLLILSFVCICKKRKDTNIQVAALMLFGMWIFHGIIHAEVRYHFSVFPMLLFLSFACFPLTIDTDAV